MRLPSILLTIIFLTPALFAQESHKHNKKQTQKKKFTPPVTVTKEDEVTIDGNTIDYTVEAGYITLQTDYGKEKAHIFYIAYTKEGGDDITERPVTFSFNGGPGSSSVWLHLGMLGPRKVKMTGKGNPPAPPYEMVDNPHSWLDQTDLVFIDPVSTGFSRAHQKKKAKQFHGYKGDIKSVGKFIRRYLNDNERWGSPKYMIGESYGTTRAAGLSNHLIKNYGIYLNGIIMVSFVNNFQTLRFTQGNDLPYPLFLPSYTATAWYHNQLPEELQQKPLTEVLSEAEEYAANKYPVALHKGQQLKDDAKQWNVKQLHRYTGLSQQFIRQANLRITGGQFRKQLLKDSLEIVGRLDARYKAKETEVLRNRPKKDPSYYPTTHAPFSTMINDYLTREIGFETKIVYEVLSHDVRPWDFAPYKHRFPNVTTHLQEAISKNPEMKVWVLNGYYDLATPYFATEYTFNHMRLPGKLHDNIEMTYYKAGHMMYVHPPSLKKAKQEAEQFYQNR